jgi:hypothetical protein
VDDVVVKKQQPDNHIADLTETFHILRRFRWKLNPAKCIFCVPSCKLLGFLVSHFGIEANPTKIVAITNLTEPKSLPSFAGADCGKGVALSSVAPTNRSAGFSLHNKKPYKINRGKEKQRPKTQSNDKLT